MDVDEPADHGRVHRVVVAGDPDVVVAGQTDPLRSADCRRDRRQRFHRRDVGDDPQVGLFPGAPQQPRVGSGQPLRQLGVVIGRAGERAAGHERRFQEPVGPLHQPLGLRVPRRHLMDPGPQSAGERAGADGQPAVLPDAGLVVPHQRLGDRIQRGQQLPHPGDQITGGPRRQQQRHDEPRERGDHRQHRRSGQHRPGIDRDDLAREPQVALHDLTGGIGGPVGRIGRAVQRPELGDLGPQHRRRKLPPHPLGDHRRRHVRELGEQLPDRREEHIDLRPTRRPGIPRRLIRGQRRPHRVPGQPQPASDRLDRQTLRPMQPADLCPIFHVDHSLTLAEGGQDSFGVRGSVLGQHRQL